MPSVSIFFGIIVRMYYNDHRPPHFHAEYQGQKATFDFNGKVIHGSIDSNTARSLIKKWALRHKHELMLNWKRLEEALPLDQIAPLE